jgi:hypothetical protein
VGEVRLLLQKGLVMDEVVVAEKLKKAAAAYSFTPIIGSTPPTLSAKKKPKGGLPPLVQDDWDKLPPKAKWDSIVALRGPDLKNSETLKWFTTSVIRHRLSGVMRVGGLVNSSLPFMVVPSYSPSNKGSEFSLEHFLGHVTEAASWLSIPMVMIEPQTWLAAMHPQNHRLTTGKLIYPHMVDPGQQKAMKTWLSGAGIEIEETSHEG